MNPRDRKEFDVPIPLKSVEHKWRELQARHRAEVRLSVIDEQHTRVSVSGDPDEIDRVFDDLRRERLGGRGAAGNPGSLGDGPGAAGGTFPGRTGGTPGPGGGKPGTTP